MKIPTASGGGQPLRRPPPVVESWSFLPVRTKRLMMCRQSNLRGRLVQTRTKIKPDLCPHCCLGRGLATRCGTDKRREVNVVAVPAWWGVLHARHSASGLRFTRVRRSKKNPNRDPRSLVELLWLDGAIRLLEHAAVRGMRGKPPQ